MMRTDLTINFLTKPICPKCGREIPIDKIVIENDSAWCSTCGREMSFIEMADYSLVKAKRRERLAKGFSVVSDSGISLTLVFKSPRIGLRIIGMLFLILFAVPIFFLLYHIFVGPCHSYPIAIGSLGVLSIIELWILACLRNEWKLHAVFEFCFGHCAITVAPTFFKPHVQKFSFERYTVFQINSGQINLYSPYHPPQRINIPFPMSAEQIICLHSLMLDFKYGITAGKFKIGAPNTAPKPLMEKPRSLSAQILHWAWIVFIVVILVARIVIVIYEAFSNK